MNVSWKKGKQDRKAIAPSAERSPEGSHREKDRTDCISDVLEEHLELSIPYHGMMKKDTFVSYVLNQRVDDEVLPENTEEIKSIFSRS